MDKVVLEELLNDDLYTTFKGFYEDKPCMVKFFSNEKSDQNNETEIMQYLKQHSKLSMLYPTVYFSILLGESKDYSIRCKKSGHLIKNVYRIICYEYIEPETPVFDFQQCSKDITLQLTDLHSHGFVYGDVRVGNIIFSKPFGKYQLIDFGRSFSISDKNYPPMTYMIDENEIPTQADDFKQLTNVGYFHDLKVLVN